MKEAVAEIIRLRPEKISLNSRIVEDLGFDSLAIAELVAFIVDTYPAQAFSDGLIDMSWDNLTIEQLVGIVTADARPATGPS